MSDRSVTHGTFIIERTFDASLSKVFQAFADQTMKEKWFKGPDDQAPNTHSMDFQVGGHESNEGAFHDGTVHRFEAQYYDIVPENRIIYAYEMYINDKRISVSLATIQLEAVDGKTQLTLTETGEFLDGFDKPEIREQGTHLLLDALEASLN